MKVLCIVAHPDDEVLGIGGTISKHVKDGDEVFIAIVSEGVSAQYKDSEKYLELRRKACKDAADFLGVKEVIFGEFPDAKLDTVSSFEINKFIEEIIDKTSPDRIYTHHWGDNHKDHKIVHESVLVAARNSLCDIYCCEIASSGDKTGIPTNLFCPNFYVDISDHLKNKLKALSFYSTELKEYPHPISEKAIEALAMVRGFKVNIKLAEAFVCLRKIER